MSHQTTEEREYSIGSQKAEELQEEIHEAEEVQETRDTQETEELHLQVIYDDGLQLTESGRTLTTFAERVFDELLFEVLESARRMITVACRQTELHTDANRARVERKVIQSNLDLKKWFPGVTSEDGKSFQVPEQGFPPPEQHRSWGLNGLYNLDDDVYTQRSELSLTIVRRILECAGYLSDKKYGEGAWATIFKKLSEPTPGELPDKDTYRPRPLHRIVWTIERDHPEDIENAKKFSAYQIFWDNNERHVIALGQDGAEVFDQSWRYLE